MPKITVLLPVFNAERHLASAIQSILDQTFKDFELLIIDDASTDTSRKIIQKFNDSRIRIIFNESNLGISASLNLGINSASTELIARMDADDISYPSRLETQYEYFLNDPDLVLLSTAVRVISDEGEFLRIDNFPKEYFYYNLNFICWIYHPTVMYRKFAVEDVGLYNVPYSEDFDLWWRISRKYKIGHVEQVLLDYRESATSLSSVIKNVEYEKAQKAQVVRNIHYYTSGKFYISDFDVNCLRFKFGFVSESLNVELSPSFFFKLEKITRAVTRTPNINLNIKHVWEAYEYKRTYTLKLAVHSLPPMKAVYLLFRLGEYKWLLDFLRKVRN